MNEKEDTKLYTGGRLVLPNPYEYAKMTRVFIGKYNDPYFSYSNDFRDIIEDKPKKSIWVKIKEWFK